MAKRRKPRPERSFSNARRERPSHRSSEIATRASGGPSAGRGGRRSVRESAQDCRARVVSEGAREPPEGASFVQRGTRRALHECRRLVPARRTPGEPERGASHGRRGTGPGIARRERGRKREAEEVPRHGAPHAAPLRQLGDESLGSSARIGRPESRDDVFRDVARQRAVEGDLDRATQGLRVLAARVPAAEPHGGGRDREGGRHRAPRGDGRGAESRPLRIPVARTQKRDVLGSEAETVKRQESGEGTEPHEIGAASGRVEPRERDGTRALDAEHEALRARSSRDEDGQERMREAHERRPARREIAAGNRPLPERLRGQRPSSAERGCQAVLPPTISEKTRRVKRRGAAP